MVAPRYGRRKERGLVPLLGQILQELRYPTTRRGKIIAGTLAVLVFSFVSLLVVGGFFLSRVLNPLQSDETIDPIGILGNAQVVPFETPDGTTHNGWFFPGLRRGPVVVLCHGYKSSRSEILTLATSLQQNRYNVFSFNFAGHGGSPVAYTTLGHKEAEELRAAVGMLAQREDLDTDRMGIWGYSLGAYAALRVAAEMPNIQVVAVDSIYPQPRALLRWELTNLGADMIPLLGTITKMEFQLFSVLYSGQADLIPALDNLAGRPKLFIVGDDALRLGEMTKDLYERAPGPKELVELPRTNMALLIEEERRSYENLLVNFFLRNLPLVAPRS